ncbi:hypothetical protein PAMA_012205 [Pampus argenteus]
MAHAASQLKKKADENLNAVEDEKEKKKAARKRSREVKKKGEVDILKVSRREESCLDQTHTRTQFTGRHRA